MSTWLGLVSLEEQADPVETAIPCWLNFLISASPSTQLKQKLALLGSLLVKCPLTMVPGIRDVSLISLSRNGEYDSVYILCSLSSTAFAKPTIPATFSVPDLN